MTGCKDLELLICSYILENGGNTGLIEELAVLEGDNADFVLLGTDCSGKEEDIYSIKQAIPILKPDVVVSEICSNRLNILNLDSSIFYTSTHMGSSFLVRFAFRKFWQYLAFLSSKKKDRNVKLGDEFVKAVHIAAGENIRVVFGDRDIWISLRRGWNALSLWGQIRLSLALMAVSTLWHRVSSRVGRLHTYHEGLDATSRALLSMSSQHPALSPILDEHQEYVRLTLRRLDRPAAALAPDGAARTARAAAAAATPQRPAGLENGGPPPSGRCRARRGADVAAGRGAGAGAAAGAAAAARGAAGGGHPCGGPGGRGLVLAVVGRGRRQYCVQNWNSEPSLCRKDLRSKPPKGITKPLLFIVSVILLIFGAGVIYGGLVASAKFEWRYGLPVGWMPEHQMSQFSSLVPLSPKERKKIRLVSSLDDFLLV